jgi:hypothetical protein
MRHLVPIDTEGISFPALQAIRLSEEARSAKLRRVSAARRAWDNNHKSVEAGEGRQSETVAREQLRRWYSAAV